MAGDDEKQPDFIFKILLIGDMGVGKSCLLLRYADNSFSTSHVSTIGVDFKIRTIQIGDKTVKLQLWDTAGQERFRTITQSYYKGAHGVIMVYDITDRKSFENLDVWLKDVKEFGEKNTGIILAGNKVDLADARAVSTDEGKNFSQKLDKDAAFLETSAKNADNVEQAFQSMVDNIFKKVNEDKITETKDDRVALNVVEGKKINKKKCNIL